jgi:thiol-disulfide isomerase/thioredoxin
MNGESLLPRSTTNRWTRAAVAQSKGKRKKVKGKRIRAAASTPPLGCLPTSSSMKCTIRSSSTGGCSNMFTIRFLVFILILGSINVAAQTTKSVAPKTPTEAWKLINLKAEEERARLAQEYAALFKVRDWKGEELLSLGNLYSLAGQLNPAHKALASYLADPKAANVTAARPVLLEVLIAEKDYEAALVLANRLLAEPDYDSSTLLQVVALIKSLAATGSKEAISLFDKTLPGLFRHAASEIKKDPQFGSTMAGMMLAEALEAGRAYRQTGDLGDSETLFKVFLDKFKASPLSADQKVSKFVDGAISQARVVGIPAPPLEGVEYIGMPKTSIESLKGKVILLDFLAHWCKPCVAELPKLNALQQKYSSQGLQIIGVTTLYGFIGDKKDVNPTDELSALNNLRTRYHVKFGFLVSPSAKDANYGVAAVPYVVTLLPTKALIDRSGKVRYLSIGSNESEIEKVIQALLAEQ